MKRWTNDNITDFESFKFKPKLTNYTSNSGTVNKQIASPLKCFSNFCRALEILLIHCEITLDLTGPSNCVIWETNRATTMVITDTKLFSCYNFVNSRQCEAASTNKIQVSIE